MLFFVHEQLYLDVAFCYGLNVIVKIKRPLTTSCRIRLEERQNKFTIGIVFEQHNNCVCVQKEVGIIFSLLSKYYRAVLLLVERRRVCSYACMHKNIKILVWI